MSVLPNILAAKRRPILRMQREGLRMLTKDGVLDVLAATILRRYLAIPALENHSLDVLVDMARGTAAELLSDGEVATEPPPHWASTLAPGSRAH